MSDLEYYFIILIFGILTGTIAFGSVYIFRKIKNKLQLKKKQKQYSQYISKTTKRNNNPFMSESELENQRDSIIDVIGAYQNLPEKQIQKELEDIFGKRVSIPNIRMMLFESKKRVMQKKILLERTQFS